MAIIGAFLYSYSLSNVNEISMRQVANVAGKVIL